MPGLDAEFTSTEPDTVDISTSEDTALPIPDVSQEVNFRQLAEEMAAKGDKNVRKLDEEVAETPAPRTKRERNPQPPVLAEPQVETEEDGEKEIVKPWARARVLEKERNQKDAELSDLRNRLDVLTGILQQQMDAKAQSTQVAEEDPDPELEPVKAILTKIEKLEKKIARVEEGGNQAREAIIQTDAISTVNSSIQSQLQEDPVFGQALMHVARVMEYSTAKKYPGLPESERLKIATQAVEATKLDWARRGADPVQETYEMAMATGFDPDAVEARLKSEGGAKKAPAPAKKADTQKQEIVQRREKERAVATVSGVEGGSPRPYDASALAKAKSTEEFNLILSNMQKAGVLPKNHGRPGGTPDFATLMALARGKR